MNGQLTKSWDVFGGLAVALLLILAAWGNALAMAIVSPVVLAIGLLVFRKHLTRRYLVGVAVAFVVAFAAAFLIHII